MKDPAMGFNLDDAGIAFFLSEKGNETESREKRF